MLCEITCYLMLCLCYVITCYLLLCYICYITCNVVLCLFYVTL